MTELQALCALVFQQAANQLKMNCQWWVHSFWLKIYIERKESNVYVFTGYLQCIWIKTPFSKQVKPKLKAVSEARIENNMKIMLNGR